MTTTQPYDWIRQIEKALIDLDQIPLLGYAPPFEWDLITTKLKQLLQIPDLEIRAGSWTWRGPDLVYENLSTDSVNLNVAVLPLQGHASIALSPKDINSLVSWIVEHRSGSNTLVSSQFGEGLLDYVLVEALHIAQSTPLFQNFLLRVLGSSECSFTRSLTLDVFLKAYKEEIMLRFIVPENLRKQWLQHFQSAPKRFPLESSKNIEVLCSLELGRVSFSYQEWKKIKKGDFIPVSANVDPESGSGSFYLSVNQKPLFRVRMKSEGLKILEQPIYEEEMLSMDDDHDDLLSEISDLEKERKQPLDPIPEEDSDLDYDEEDDDSFDLDEDEESDEKISVKKEKSELEKIGMVPLNVVVEVARFKMTCEKLLHLKPGNLIELDVSLDRPVDLVVNGKKIGMGELVRIGDSLGVQVTDMG